MSYHPRIESKELASFVTTRSRNSELWFVNNDPLEEAILGYAAKYQKRYDVKLYALAIEGNHIQAPAHFPKLNRSDFMRDFNSSVALAVDRLTKEYPGGKFWGRRYSGEFLPEADDIEEYFFYTVLQPVEDGLVERISEYPGYNSFHDAAWGIKRTFEVVDWTAYNNAKRKNPNLSIKNYIEEVELEYSRLPGYEDMPQKKYAKMLLHKLEQRRAVIVNKRRKEGLGFMGREALLKQKRGALPKNTKTSTSSSHRPRVLCVCPIRRATWLQWYFETYFAYKEASLAYRNGDLLVEFPPGTYRPYFRGPPG